MYEFFWFSVAGMILIFPLYYISLAYMRLDQKFGANRGRIIGNTLGIISGWGFFLFWIGIWVSPQPLITFPFYLEYQMLFNLIVSLPLIIIAIIIGLVGLKNVSLKVAETHRPTEVINTGMYKLIRHPQYLGGFIAHIGITFMLSAEYSLFLTPFMTLYIFAFSKKEEIELERVFGEEYRKYKKKVPMFIPFVF